MKEKELKHNFSAKYVELPDLLFGEVMGVSVFNASAYLRNSKNEKTIDRFRQEKNEIISEYAKILELDVDQFFLRDASGDTLVRGELALLFISYVSASFNIYCNVIMDELLLNGFVVSDRYLTITAARRLSKKVFEELAK